MGTTPVKLNNATDTWVSQYKPTTAMGTTGSLLYASSVATKGCRTLLYWSLPFPKGVTIISAKLRLVQFTGLSGTVNVSVRRAAAAWSATRATWNAQPAQTGSTVTVSKASSPHATVWEWDVTALLQTVSSGSPWYGFVVSSDSTASTFRAYSPSTTYLNYRPVLEVSWKDNPQKPTEMHPSDGRAVSLAKPTVSTNFIDVSGDTTMQSINVRVFDTEVAAQANTTPTWDSGTVAADSPELDLNTTAYPGAAADSVKYWRVRVQDGAGLWSDWSNYTSFTVKTKGVLAMTNPAGATVSDSSPPITWTFTGRTQKAYQVIVLMLDGTKYTTTWDSGKITSTALNATVGAGAMKYNDRTYRIVLRAWDTVDRETIPGDTAYVQVSQDVTYSYDATTNPPTGLVGTVDPTYPAFPWMKLTWSRATMPDDWTIYRDGKVIKQAEGVELFTTGTSYTYTDRLADPRIQHTWMVVAVVNGKGSASSPTVTSTLTTPTTLLSRVDGTNPILIWDPDVDMALSEESGIFQPAGAAPPILITQSEHGYQGHVKGRLASSPVGPQLTAQQWRDGFNRLKKNNGTKLLLTIVDSSFECFIANASIRPYAFSPGVTDYLVEFDFYQTDWEEIA